MAGRVRSLCLCWRLVQASAVVMMTGKVMPVVRDDFYIILWHLSCAFACTRRKIDLRYYASKQTNMV